MFQKSINVYTVVLRRGKNMSCVIITSTKVSIYFNNSNNKVKKYSFIIFYIFGISFNLKV